VERGGTKVVAIRLRNDLLAKTDERAAKLGITRNRLLVLLLDEFAVRMTPADVQRVLNAQPTKAKPAPLPNVFG
jgi:hypothetical protein